jgi:hypothetical protein
VPPALQLEFYSFKSFLSYKYLLYLDNSNVFLNETQQKKTNCRRREETSELRERWRRPYSACSTEYYAVHRDIHRLYLLIDVWDKDKDKKQNHNHDVHKESQRITKEYQNLLP